MAKRKVIRKSNRPFTYNPHYYSWGGEFLKALNLKKGAFNFKNTFSGANVANMLKGGAASAIGSAVGNIAGSAIGGGLESGAGSAISNIGGTMGSVVSAVNPVLGGIVSAGTGILGGVTNALFGSKLNQEKINEIEGSNRAMNTVMVDSSSVDSVENQWANQDFGADFSKSDIGKDGLFSSKAKKKYRALKKQQDIARSRALASYENAAEAADTQADLNAMASFAAFGGPLGIWGGYGSGAIGYELDKENLGIKALNAANKGRLTSLPNSFGSELNTFADGGKIYIKPENRGKFTALKERTGKSATWFKEHGTPAQKKMATFALNARKWKHEDGGPIKKKTFEDWYKTIPADRNDTTSYNLRRAYELAPYNELEAWRTSSMRDLKAGKNHLRTVYKDPKTGIYEFVKSKNHSTLHNETDWYNSDDPEAVKFRNNYDLDMSGDYYKYVPKKKAFGGDLLTHGAEWDNGLRVIGNGGTHEENPMEGVPMGMDAEGTPNLVEQGEVIFNDYVFSNRLFADGGLLESFNLPKSYDGHSFAAIAEKLGDESKERPNDPISKRGLLSSMSRLQQAQETVRQQNQEGQEGVQYAHGGRMGTLFDGLGDRPNFLDGVDYGDWQDYGTLLEPISAEDVWNEAVTGTSRDDKWDNNSELTWLRYAPVVGAAIGLGQNLFSKPDYTSADTILEAANQAGNYTPIKYTPIGNYLQYRSFDRNFYLNKLNAQAGATRRAIINTTSPSRNAALLAADYNAQGRLGDLARQAEEYNLAQRQATETFNRGTNMANTEMGLKAAMANQEAALKARSSRLSGVAQAMAVRDAVDARRGASMSANLTNFFNSLGDIGREEYSRNMIMSNPALYYSIDSKGNVTYKNGYESLSEAEKKEVRDAANKAKKKKAKGGYLTIKKK